MNGTESLPALEVVDLVKRFDGRGQLLSSKAVVHAVEGVSFSLARGEVLGLVGESGSGKTTVANCVVRLVEPTAGRIVLDGTDITHLTPRQLRPLRRGLHMVFQDPSSSLDPRMSCGSIVAEPLRLHRLARGRELEARVAHDLRRGRPAAGVPPSLPPRALGWLASAGGDRPGAHPRAKRARRGRAGVQALDVSVQASILNLLRDLQRGMGFSCLFITHDLATVEFLCDRVAVMYLGEIVETAPKAELFRAPQHPYTQALLSAAVVADPRRQRAARPVLLEGELPSPLDPPSGCRFHTRCPLHEQSRPLSDEERPSLREFAPGHLVACHLVERDGATPRLRELTAAAAT